MFADDYLFVKIDAEEMPNGSAVAGELMKNRSGGFPWFTILDADGKELISSNNQAGANIGAPIGPEERKHFVEMMRVTAQSMSPERLKQVESALAEHAQAYL